MIKENLAAFSKSVERFKKVYEDHYDHYVKTHYDHYQTSLNKLTSFENDIIARLITITNKKITDKHCYSCGCSPRLFTDGWLTEDGIELRKDADHPNDIVDVLYSWNEIDILLM